MKDVVFALGVFGTIVSWLLWGILAGCPTTRTKARMFLASGIVATLFIIGWSIKYGA